MNLRGGWALIKSSWASWMQYRGFFFVLAFGWMVPPLVSLFVWSTAAVENPVAGLTRGGFVAYYLVIVIANQLTYAQANWTLGDMIREGILNSWLLRPIAPLFHVLAAEIAGKVVTLAFVLPATAGLALILRPELEASLPTALLFFASLLLAWALRFFWGCALALVAFWSARADSLLGVQDALVFLLAGIVAPVGILPGPMQAIAQALPFRYMVGFPVEILIGRLGNGEIVFGLACQTAWLVVAALAYAILWQTGIRRYTAIGG